MSKRMMSGLLCAAAMVFASGATAQVVQFEFCGYTTYSNAMAREGTPVVGQLSWDTSAPAWLLYSGPTSSYYAAPDTGRFSFSVGRHSVATDATWVMVWNDTGSNVGDMIDINGESLVIDGTLFDQSYFSIRLATAYGNNAVFQDTSLPSELDIAEFDSVGMNYFQMYNGLASNDLILDVNLAWIQRAADARPGQSERRECLPRAAASR